MKKYFYLLISILFIACHNPKDDKPVDTLNAAPKTSVTNTQSSKLLRSIMGNGEGLIRGINFGDSITEVKKLESAELFEETEDHIGYTFDTNELETIDILYKNNPDRKVNSIQIDAYMNSKKSNDSLFQAFQNLFTIRYGKPVTDSLSATWKIKPVGSVLLKDVSRTKDKGLTVLFKEK